MLRTLALLLALAGCASAPSRPATAPRSTPAAARSPVDAPAPLRPPPAFSEAIAAGTRNASGEPGPRYWRNTARYALRARVDTDGRRLAGQATIHYRNVSPDTLALLHLELAQNLHRPGAVRFEEAEVTAGVALQSVAVNGTAISEQGDGARFGVFGTRLLVLPPRPLLPGDSVRLDIGYAFDIPRVGAGGRMGHSGDDLVFIAYWYPQMVVYDDIVGWHPDPFVGTTEFYAGFADYTVEIDAPAGWIVAGTGTLENAVEVLQPQVRQRLAAAGASDTVVQVLAPADFPARVTTAAGDARVTWRLRADAVRDVAFTVSRNVHWDALRARVDDAGRATLVNAIYRPAATRWRNTARYGAHAITFLSRFTGIPYPWPHITAVEGGGIIGGGMEYPMMTLIGDYRQAGDEALYNVTAHELAHMWVPMLVATDERRYSWMDEGMTQFAENEARADTFPGRRHWLPDQDDYLMLARMGEEGEMMRRSSFHYSPAAFTVASYSKPAAVLVALRAVLGDSTFHSAYRTFLRDWQYRHPYPWDFFNTMERVSGRDLDWFWRAWYFGTGTLDQAVASVASAGDTTHIVIEDRGDVPMPAPVLITFADGTARTEVVPVEHWLRGERRARLSIATRTAVTRVEIDPGRLYPDVERANNAWQR